MNLAVITGTSQGLGRETSDVFRANDWEVLSLSRPEFFLERAGELATGLLAPAAKQQWDRVVLINNAASIHIERIDQQSPEVIASELTANIIGPIQLMNAFLKAFPNGEIVNVTTGAVTTDFDGWSLYAVAKTAIDRHIKALTSEGHKASSFYPGVFDTNMQKKIRASQFKDVETFKGLLSNGKLKDASEVAAGLFAHVS